VSERRCQHCGAEVVGNRRWCPTDECQRARIRSKAVTSAREGSTRRHKRQGTEGAKTRAERRASEARTVISSRLMDLHERERERMRAFREARDGGDTCDAAALARAGA
jgi:hypothetical protein